MKQPRKSFLVKLIHWWEADILNHPWLILLLSIVACVAVGKYTMDNLTVNTNTADMISLEVPFQKNRIKLETAFPQDVSAVLLLVEGDTPERTAQAVERIADGLRQEHAEIKKYFIPDDGPFFAQNGLLYLTDQELQQLSEKLAQAQPFLGRLSGDNSLKGLLGILGDALNEKDQGIELAPVLSRLTAALRAATEGRPYQLSWQQLMMQKNTGLGITKRFVLITPVLHYEELLPAEKSLNRIAEIVATALQGDLASVKVLTTGEVVLEHEEMKTVGESTTTAGIASMILVCLTLWFAYRSFKLMIATFLSLSMGLVFSLGFATVSIGHLNLISIAFAVLFIGMGDAYSSHFCLRYRELVLRGESQQDALRDTLISTGGSLFLCTVTAAIGLYAFIPTSYVGVSELGIIAGTSMFIALGTTFTVLPALMKIMPYRPPAKRRPKSRIASNWPLRYARPIRWITVLLTIGSAVLVTRVTVDFNPINLRDPNTESVKTYKYLLTAKDTSPMTLSALATTPEEVRAKQAKFEQLPSVDKVVTLFDFIPEAQDEKMAQIEELGLVLGTRLSDFPPPSSEPFPLASLQSFRTIVEARRTRADSETLANLSTALDAFEKRLEVDPDEAARQARLDRLQSSVLSGLPATIQKLQQSLNPTGVTLESLPPELRERWLSNSGLYRIQIYPKKDLNDLENLREFIREGQTVDPDVTDVPVTYLESMQEVVVAFQEAFTLAMGAITLLLLILLRSLKDTLLVLLPLWLASLYTAAGTVLFDVPFNFANIIVLPLLFGLGVDNGIHMAHRLHYLHSEDENLLSTSEAQGVFYGALTTIFSFSSLAFTPHRGTASMGMLLALGLLMTLVCALVVLPAFSALKLRRRSS